MTIIVDQFVYFLLIINLLVSCTTASEAGFNFPNSEEAFQIKKRHIQLKEMQTKRYHKITEKKIFITATKLLQNSGFVIKESSFKLGVITAEKRKGVTNGGQITFNIALIVLGGQPALALKKDQKIRVSFVTRRHSDNSTVARVSFQKIIWDTNNEIRQMEYIDNSKIYENFFSKLSKAIFLKKEGV